MKFSIPLKDVLLGPGKRFDASVNTEAEVIACIKKTYGVMASSMDISISNGMVCIAFKDATPIKVNEALQDFEKAVKKAQSGKLSEPRWPLENPMVVARSKSHPQPVQQNESLITSFSSPSQVF